jgi:hypothetical protein
MVRGTPPGESLIVAFQESLRVLGRKCHHEAIIGVRQVHALEVRLLLHAADHHQRFAEIGLRFPRRMRQWHEYFLVLQPRLANIILHHCVTAVKAMLAF